jgi:hypothetical protein
VPTGSQYQTYHLLTYRHTTKGRDLGSYWRGSSQRPSKELLQLERNTAPSMRRTQLSKEEVQLHKRGVSTAGQETAVIYRSECHLHNCNRFLFPFPLFMYTLPRTGAILNSRCPVSWGAPWQETYLA